MKKKLACNNAGGVLPKGQVLWEREALPPHDVLIGHFWRGGACPGLPVSYILSSGWISGFRRASATGGPRTLTGSSHSWKGGRPLLAGGSGSDCPATSLVNRGAPKRHLRLSGWSTRRNPENRDLEASFWGPPHDEPFWATRQHSTTRGEPPFQRRGLAQLLGAGQTGRKAIYQAVWPLSQGQGGAGGGRFSTKRFC